MKSEYYSQLYELCEILVNHIKTFIKDTKDMKLVILVCGLEYMSDINYALSIENEQYKNIVNHYNKIINKKYRLEEIYNIDIAKIEIKEIIDGILRSEGLGLKYFIENKIEYNINMVKNIALEFKEDYYDFYLCLREILINTNKYKYDCDFDTKFPIVNGECNFTECRFINIESKINEYDNNRICFHGTFKKCTFDNIKFDENICFKYAIFKDCLFIDCNMTDFLKCKLVHTTFDECTFDNFCLNNNLCKRFLSNNETNNGISKSAYILGLCRILHQKHVNLKKNRFNDEYTNYSESMLEFDADLWC